jgi:hypothetical protein
MLVDGWPSEFTLHKSMNASLTLGFEEIFLRRSAR